MWWNEHSIKKGWVIMKGKFPKNNVYGDNMIRGECETWEKSQMNLTKCYQNVLAYDSVMLMKKPVSMNTLIKLLKVNAYLILMMRWSII